MEKYEIILSKEQFITLKKLLQAAMLQHAWIRRLNYSDLYQLQTAYNRFLPKVAKMENEPGKPRINNLRKIKMIPPDAHALLYAITYADLKYGTYDGIIVIQFMEQMNKQADELRRLVLTRLDKASEAA